MNQKMILVSFRFWGKRHFNCLDHGSVENPASIHLQSAYNDDIGVIGVIYAHRGRFMCMVRMYSGCSSELFEAAEGRNTFEDGR